MVPAMSEQRVYKPDGEVLLRYLLSTKSMVCIQGPVRSGKSVASIMRLYRGMMNAPITEGKRRSRWLVTRNSYPDLEESTMKTWLEWFPEKIYGRMFWTPPYRHEMRFGDIEADVTFESFKGEEGIPSLKSREYTGIWVNEGQFYTRKFIVALYERTGWFPIPGGEKFLQVDMNAPPHGHWVPMMRGDAPIPEEMDERERMSLKKPADWEFLTQPAWFLEKLDPQGKVDEYVINPAAENLRILTAHRGNDAVLELLSGRTKDEIDADLMNRVTIQTKGKPVFPMFRRETHVAKAPLEPMADVVIHVGLDFGRTPAAVIAQCVAGRWFILAELIGDNVGAVTFAPALKRFLATRFPGFRYLFWGDPAGGYKGQESEQTAFDIFKANGLNVRAADTGNRRRIRIETATNIMNRMVHGLPGLLVSPTCPALITAWGGGYVFKRKSISGPPVYDEEPLKNEHSHVSDGALEIFMGGGEGLVTLGRTEKPAVIHTKPKTDAFGRPVRAMAVRR
jgi:hypothetical protein